MTNNNWYCFIPGKPQRKRAHKTTRAGHYFDPDTKIKEQLSDWILENIELPNKPFEGPIEIVITSFFQLPKGLSNLEKFKRLHERYCWQKKIDTDNISKLHKDILCYGQLEGKIMTDDKLICLTIEEKFWTDGEENVQIRIKPLGAYNEAKL